MLNNCSKFCTWIVTEDEAGPMTPTIFFTFFPPGPRGHMKELALRACVIGLSICSRGDPDMTEEEEEEAGSNDDDGSKYGSGAYEWSVDSCDNEDDDIDEPPAAASAL